MKSVTKNLSEEYFRYLFEKYSVDINPQYETQYFYYGLNNKIPMNTGKIVKQNIFLYLDYIDSAEVFDHLDNKCSMSIDNKKCFVAVESYHQTDEMSRLEIIIH